MTSKAPPDLQNLFGWRIVHVPLSLVQWLTDFGDQSIVIPLILIGFVVLAFTSRRAAFRWASCTGGVLVVMLLLKLALGACAPRLGVPALTTPSGHTASSTVVYGCLLAILLPGLGRRTLGLVAVGIASLFGMSRVILHDHTVPEVVVGAAIGLTGAFVFFSLMKRSPAASGRPKWFLLLAFLLPLIALHGHRLPAEQQIHFIAATWLRDRLCPVPRNHHFTTGEDVGLPHARSGGPS